MATSNGQDKQLSTRPGKPEQTALTPQQQALNGLRVLLEKSTSQIKMALPRHMTAERLVRVALTAASKTPALLECTQLSFIGAVIQSAQLGLEPDGVLGHAYLVPFRNRKQGGRREVQLIVGYKGYIDLARRSGHVSSIQAHVVHENDFFDFAFGLEDKLVHKPAETDRGRPRYAYAIAKFRDSGYAFDVMSHADVEDIRKMSQAADGDAWTDHWDEMAKKTVIRRLCKYLPLSPELQRAVTLTETAEAGVSMTDLNVIDADSEVVAEATAQRTEQLREKYDPEGKPNGGSNGGEGATGDGNTATQCACPDGPAGTHVEGCALGSKPEATGSKGGKPDGLFGEQ